MKLISSLLAASTVISCVPKKQLAAVRQAGSTHSYVTSAGGTPLFHWTTNKAPLSDVKGYVAREIQVARSENAKVGSSVKLTQTTRAGFGLYTSGDPVSSRDYGNILVAFKTRAGQKVALATAGVVDILPASLVNSPEAAIDYWFLNDDLAQNYPFSRQAMVIREPALIDESSYLVLDKNAPASGHRRVFEAIPLVGRSDDFLIALKNYSDHLKFMELLLTRRRNVFVDEETWLPKPKDGLLALASELTPPLRPEFAKAMNDFLQSPEMSREQAGEDKQSLCKASSLASCVDAFIEVANLCYSGMNPSDAAPENRLSMARFKRMAASLRLIDAPNNLSCTADKGTNLTHAMLTKLNSAERVKRYAEILASLGQLFEKTSLDFWH